MNEHAGLMIQDLKEKIKLLETENKELKEHAKEAEAAARTYKQRWLDSMESLQHIEYKIDKMDAWLTGMIVQSETTDRLRPDHAKLFRKTRTKFKELGL